MRLVGFAGQRFGGAAPEEMFEDLSRFFGELLQDFGPDRVYVSSGVGTDLAFMDASRTLGIPYVVVEPFHNHTSLWPAYWARVYDRLARDALEVVTLQVEYSPGVFDRRFQTVAQSVPEGQGEVWTFWDGSGDRGVARIMLYAPRILNTYQYWLFWERGEADA